MIDPPPWSFMWRAAIWVPSITPSRSTLMTRSKSAKSSSSRLGTIRPETEEREDGERDEFFQIIATGHVDMLERTVGAQAGGQCLALFAVDVGDDDTCSLVEELLHGGGADSCRAAGDDRDLVRQFV